MSLQNDNGDAKEKGFEKNRTKMQHAIMKNEIKLSLAYALSKQHKI